MLCNAHLNIFESPCHTLHTACYSHHISGQCNRPRPQVCRAVPGHWEGDLIVGSNNSYIATLVERHSRFVMLAKVENKDTQSVITALIKQARKLPKDRYRSLTWDRGSEMAGTASSLWPQRSTSIFATHSRLGKEVATKTPIDCYANISPKAPTYRALAKRNSAPSPASLTRDPERPCNTKHLLRSLTHVMRRPVETTGLSGRSHFMCFPTQMAKRIVIHDHRSK